MALATLEILFVKPDGSEITKSFTKRPLGMEFVQKMPLKVVRCRCESRELGVGPGWVIKAVGGVHFDTIDFEAAFRQMEHAVGPLKPHFPLPEGRTPSSVGAMMDRVGPVGVADVPAFLLGFGYHTTDSAWTPEKNRPVLALGEILGHREKGIPYAHTWYLLQCSISRPAANMPGREWLVERRLAHLRICLHDPVRTELGKKYDNHFRGAHFAHHGGPPGTSERLKAWLKVLGQLMNNGHLSPSLTAAILRFLEAPFLSRGGARDLKKKKKPEITDADLQELQLTPRKEGDKEEQGLLAREQTGDLGGFGREATDFLGREETDALTSRGDEKAALIKEGLINEKGEAIDVRDELLRERTEEIPASLLKEEPNLYIFQDGLEDEEGVEGPGGPEGTTTLVTKDMRMV